MLPVEAFSVPVSANRGDVTAEAEGSGLAAPSAQVPGERQGLSGVARLVDSPG